MRLEKRFGRIDLPVVERQKNLSATAFERLLAIVGVGQEILQRRQQERSELPLLPICARKGFVFDQVAEKTLRQILCVMHRVAAAAHKTVKRRPIGLAKLCERSMRNFRSGMALPGRENKAPMGRSEGIALATVCAGQNFHSIGITKRNERGKTREKLRFRAAPRQKSFWKKVAEQQQAKQPTLENQNINDMKTISRSLIPSGIALRFDLFHTVALRGFLFAMLALAWFALSPTARAADGGVGNRNTAEGNGALFSLTSGLNNTAVGFHALYSNTTGSFDSANGSQALFSNTTGPYNTATGFQALYSNTTGDSNTASGVFALASNTTGNENTAIGNGALISNGTGNYNTVIGSAALIPTPGNLNIALGYWAGFNFTGTTGDNNIYIGSQGVAGESNTIRIGERVPFVNLDGVTLPAHKRTFIAGISGVAVNGCTVVVNSNGRLGVAASSARFKEAIKPMDKASETILALRPVTFRYKKEIDPDSTPQFGLVAEEVAKINPALVNRGADGKVFTVRYDAVNAMLLNEFLKEHHKVAELEGTIAQQQKDFQSALALQKKDLQASIAEQQDEIKSLAVGLKEQGDQLRKVSNQFEINKPAPRVVATNP
jgi:hypothetical protein